MNRITQDSISFLLAKKLENCLQEISFINDFPIVPKDYPNFPIYIYIYIYSQSFSKFYSIFNNFCTLGLYIMKPPQYTPNN
jgi:hypothetical protein